MYLTQFNHARFFFLLLVFWSRVFWPSVTWNLRRSRRWSKSVWTSVRSLSPALRNLWLLLLVYIRRFSVYGRGSLFYVKQSLVSQSVQGMNPLQTWTNFSALFIQDSLNKFNIVGKISAVLEVVVWKKNHKPLKQLNISQWTAKSSHDREVILLIGHRHHT